MAKIKLIGNYTPILYSNAKALPNFLHDQKDRESFDNGIRSVADFKPVISKLSSSSSFSSAEEAQLKIFVRRIAAGKNATFNNTCVYNWINHFGDYPQIVDLINYMIDSSTFDNLKTKITGLTGMSVYQKDALPYLFSIIKHYQQPNDYPMMYIFWMNICDVYFATTRHTIINGKNVDYDKLCDIYNTIGIPASDAPKHSYFSAYMEALAGELARKIAPNIGGYTKGAISDVFNVDGYDGILYPAPGQASEPAGADDSEGDSQEGPKEPYHHPLNLILYGPPGTGKTYNTVNEALSAIEGKIVENLQKEDRNGLLKRFNEYKDKGQIVFTTFHQSLGYEEFIEGIKPIPDSSPIGAEHTNKNSSGSNQFGEGTTTISNLVRMKYEVKPGLFKELCETAIEKSQDPFVLIIDEINRGNVSQIFGELITLIEESKRTTKWDKGTYVDNPEKIEVKLPYSHEQFGVPGNLYIIGTMNTADRSVEALDTALRRRFEFKEMMPKPELLEDKICGHELKDILTTINNRIRALKDREHQIGHSYFMGRSSEDDLKNVFKNNIVPLLQEYFYGNYTYIGLVLGEEFVKEDEDVSKIVFADFRAADVPEKETVYRLLTEKEWEDLDLPKAIASLMSKKDGTKKDETVAGEPGKTDKNSEEVG